MPKKKIVYFDPFGTQTEAFDPAEIKRMIVDKNEDYWNSPVDTGTGMLEYYDLDVQPRPTASLVLTMKNEAGFHINYTRNPSGYGSEFFVLVANDEFDDTIWVHAGGEKRRLARALFVSRAHALEAVTFFLDNGGMSPKIKWVPYNSIPWGDFEEFA
ncbi:MAG TPA: hypothetical protein VFE62_08260 [Gemmataceae bacterium]|nr:hypothetical protein [Gemmataceae bacterium]